MKLRAHRSVGFERQSAQSCRDPFGFSMNRDVRKVRLQFEVLPLFDSYVRMTASVTDGIPAELDRMFSSIPDEASFFVKERVLSVSREEQKRPLETEVLDVRKPGRFAASPRSLSKRDAVLFDDVLVYGPRILFLRDLSAHVEKVSTADVGNG
jgi:hypothetical protein